MITLADFSPYVLPYADSCPEFVVQDGVLATIQDFYRNTKEKEAELPAIDVVADTNVYTLTVTDAHVFEVRQALYSGRGLVKGDPVGFETDIGADWRQRAGTPTCFYMPGLDQIRLVVTPDASLTGGLFVVGLTYPSSDVTSFDDILLEELRDTIVAGALSRILSQQDQKWTDLKQAVLRGIAYQEGINSHRRHVAHGRVGSRKRTKGYYF